MPFESGRVATPKVLEEILKGEQDYLHCGVLHRALPKMRDGMIIYADGSDFDPGRGEGVYAYIGGEYKLLTSEPPIIIPGTVSGKPTNGQIVCVFPAPIAFTIPAGLSGSRMVAGTAATGTSVFTLKKNGTSFGTMTFAAAGTTATLSAASATAVSTSDIITITAPGTADATLANVGWTVIGWE